MPIEKQMLTFGLFTLFFFCLAPLNNASVIENFTSKKHGVVKRLEMLQSMIEEASEQPESDNDDAQQNQISDKILSSQGHLSFLKRLPKPMLQNLAQLYVEGKEKQVNHFLQVAWKIDRFYRKQKCQLFFSFELCSNSSAHPFFLWAKISANKILHPHRNNNL